MNGATRLSAVKKTISTPSMRRSGRPGRPVFGGNASRSTVHTPTARANGVSNQRNRGGKNHAIPAATSATANVCSAATNHCVSVGAQGEGGQPHQGERDGGKHDARPLRLLPVHHEGIGHRKQRNDRDRRVRKAERQEVNRYGGDEGRVRRTAMQRHEREQPHKQREGDGPCAVRIRQGDERTATPFPLPARGQSR